MLRYTIKKNTFEYVIADIHLRQFRQFLQDLWCESLGRDVSVSCGPVSCRCVWCGADSRDTGTAVPSRTRAVCVAAGYLFGCISDRSNRIRKSLQNRSAPLNLQAVWQFAWTNNFYSIYSFLTPFCNNILTVLCKYGSSYQVKRLPS